MIPAMATMSLRAVAEPSDDHVHLASAAEWAVTTSNVKLLEALLQAGVQINEPVEDILDWTLLHHAAGSGTERVVQFLVDNGACPDCPDQAGTRPIDLAYQGNRTNICNILANTRPEPPPIDGFPEGLLERVFLFHRDNPVLVSVNGKDPSDKLLDWLQRNAILSNALPDSKGELLEDGESGEKFYQNIESKERMARCVVTIKKLDVQEYSWTVLYYEGPLAGFFENGKARNQYGYWIKTESEGGIF